MGTVYKRSYRNYLVSRDLQLHLISQSFIYVCIMVLVSIGIILYPLIHDILFLDDLDRQYQAAQTFLSLVKWLIPTILLLLVLFMGHLIVITHRICGPLVNFVHTFDRLAQGDLTRKVHLRKGDYLSSECERINHMIDGISDIITLQDIKEQVNGIDTKEKIEVLLEMIRQEAKHIADTLAYFRTGDKEPGENHRP